MNTQYISVRFKANPELTEIVTAILMDAGFEGSTEQEGETTVSIKKELLDEEWLKEILQSYHIPYSIETVEQQNWNAVWESSFEPVVVGNFAALRASFHQPMQGVEHDIIITPKMSFGTGHHATTYLMVEQMQKIDFAGKTVIDFGTGTGILAILAEKLGAKKIIATDNDEWSINNAKENIEANACNNIELMLANNLPAINLPKADIILANINLNVIIENLAALKSVAVLGAVVLFSGLMEADEQKISFTLQASGFNIIEIVHKNGWLCLYTTC